MTRRPDPPHNPDPGFHWEARIALNWRLDPGRKCRTSVQHPCPKLSVAALARIHHFGLSRGGQQVRWWAYCEDHLYGRWVEDGQVMEWVLRKDGDPS